MPATDAYWMALALNLAERGRGGVEPNPMVGCVLVRDGEEIGRGWHRRYGGPHAERDALNATREAGHDPAGATVYVTLEPCCHYGKTPPCTDALIEAGVRRVVVAMGDPDESVRGRGIQQLREAGLDVTVGVLAEKARTVLGGYLKLRTQRRPWVLCKWAQ
ncbi:MAG: bifunctional diaminohydroxyphosphoribosylaminopyrimidine deaminase/5-amino-6-(5-phosphoribosylamino)uracil reductase RibD, partial [Planctomycetota bacterium]